MDKNNDLLYRNLSQCMYACDHPLLKKLFPEGMSRAAKDPIKIGLFRQFSERTVLPILKALNF